MQVVIVIVIVIVMLASIFMAFLWLNDLCCRKRWYGEWNSHVECNSKD